MLTAVPKLQGESVQACTVVVLLAGISPAPKKIPLGGLHQVLERILVMTWTAHGEFVQLIEQAYGHR